MDDQRRAGDLAEPVGDVLPAVQAGERLAEEVLVAGPPLGDPPRVLRLVGDDQVGDRIRPVRPRDRRRTTVGACRPRRPSSRRRARRPRCPAGSSARTRSGAVSATRNERNPPWLIPPTTARSIPRWSSSAEAVAGRVPVAERLAVVLGLAEAALVPRDHAVRRRRARRPAGRTSRGPSGTRGRGSPAGRRRRCPRSRSAGRSRRRTARPEATSVALVARAGRDTGPMRFAISYSTPDAPAARSCSAWGPGAASSIVGDDTVDVRMGWAFHVTIPRSAVGGVEHAEPVRFTRGVHGWNGRYLVNGRGDGLVTITARTGPSWRDGRLLGQGVRGDRQRRAIPTGSSPRCATGGRHDAMAGRRLLAGRGVPRRAALAGRGARRGVRGDRRQRARTRSASRHARTPPLPPSAPTSSKPFGGVPIGVKELDHVTGWPYTHASVPLRDDVSDVTSTMVERISGAGGAVLAGQTTASEFGGVNVTRTVLHGTTHNPWQHGTHARRQLGRIGRGGGRRARHAGHRRRRRRLDPHPGRVHRPVRAEVHVSAGSRWARDASTAT